MCLARISPCRRRSFPVSPSTVLKSSSSSPSPPAFALAAASLLWEGSFAASSAGSFAAALTSSGRGSSPSRGPSSSSSSSPASDASICTWSWSTWTRVTMWEAAVTATMACLAQCWVTLETRSKCSQSMSTSMVWISSSSRARGPTVERRPMAFTAAVLTSAPMDAMDSADFPSAVALSAFPISPCAEEANNVCSSSFDASMAL
mmetsp:Transcript_28817/g.84145  ORF Transcript_28817/g.84145 Transcript_28817/m.84145 type:complete len:204 (-) Transcript_28817:507-1118(-)